MPDAPGDPDHPRFLKGFRFPMIFSRLHLRIAGLLCLLPLASCSLIPDSGPLKNTITGENTPFTLITVKSQGDIPPQGRTYGSAQVPRASKGQAYSDKVRSRDTLFFIVTDLSSESPFYSKGEPYKFGPVEVPEDGRVEIPYVGTVQVIDRSLSQVSVELGEKIKPVSSTARTSVIRTNRLPKTANVMGEVKNPGPVPLERTNITSIDLLSASGGPKDEEHLFKYNLRRDGKEYAFDYLGFRQHPFPVEEGDLLTVAADTANRFHVMGAINQPITVPFPVPSPTLADALGAATGLDERRSDASGVFVFRKGSPDLVYTFDLKDPGLIHLIQRFPIQGNDIVYVTEAPLARWNRLISQILPSSISSAANAASRFTNN
jgi:protein involved in polysaccharide export with SLBB domain